MQNYLAKNIDYRLANHLNNLYGNEIYNPWKNYLLNIDQGEQGQISANPLFGLSLEGMRDNRDIPRSEYMQALKRSIQGDKRHDGTSERISGVQGMISDIRAGVPFSRQVTNKWGK